MKTAYLFNLPENQVLKFVEMSFRYESMFNNVNDNWTHPITKERMLLRSDTGLIHIKAVLDAIKNIYKLETPEMRFIQALESIAYSISENTDIKEKDKKQIEKKLLELYGIHSKYFNIDVNNFDSKFTVPIKTPERKKILASIDNLLLFDSQEKINEQIKKYFESLQKYESIQSLIDIALEEIASLSRMKKDDTIAVSKKLGNANLNFNNFKNIFKRYDFEKAKTDFPDSFEEFKKYLAPYMETISSYSENKDFIGLFGKNLLPELSAAFVPITIETQSNNDREIHILHLSLHTQKDFMPKVKKINYLENGLNNEAVFLNEKAVKTAMEKADGDLGNAYLCLEAGYIKDIRFSNDSLKDQYGPRTNELLEMIRHTQEKEKLLAHIPLIENEPTSSTGSRPKVKL